MLYVLDLAPPERISRTVIEFFAVERAITLFQSFLVMLLEHRTDVPSSLVVYLLQVVLALGAYMLYLLNKVESPRLLISQRKGLEAKAALLTLYGGEKDVGRGHDEMLNHTHTVVVSCEEVGTRTSRGERIAALSIAVVVTIMEVGALPTAVPDPEDNVSAVLAMTSGLLGSLVAWYLAQPKGRNRTHPVFGDRPKRKAIPPNLTAIRGADTQHFLFFREKWDEMNEVVGVGCDFGRSY
ncbi:MAG: uncharacterized protein KVP18_004140 [Porospora cf. gigantea A]|uniref:uncharacterized protein n=1 Tax=Porospora cf. gigantea A TaxID=2853593 RepID=UPI00355A4BF6|nr:MAG: hypothetical protein KVP18_004140 [Porospora cf. gigantea A]